MFKLLTLALFTAGGVQADLGPAFKPVRGGEASECAEIDGYSNWCQAGLNEAMAGLLKYTEQFTANVTLDSGEEHSIHELAMAVDNTF